MRYLLLSDRRIDRVFIDVTRDVRASVHLDVLEMQELECVCVCAEMSFQLIVH
jgi:hypothetical protein